MAETFEKIGSVVGFAGDVIGLAGFVKDTLFPESPPADFNNFRVYVGEYFTRDEERDSRSIGGDAPALAAWNVIGDFMSQETPDGVTNQKIAAGHFRDYAIKGRQEVDYLSVVQNGNDGICIHLITGESANAGRRFAWNGDLGKACGAPWYPQSNPVSNIGSEGDEYRPACVWIDGNGDSEFKGFSLHLGSFGGDLSEGANKLTADAWTENKDLLCKSEPRFSMYEDIKIGMQTAFFKTSPTTAKPGTPEYNDAVLNRENWGWSEAPSPGEIPQRLSGKTLVPSFFCPEKKCPPSGGSFDMDLGIPEFTRRSNRRRASKRQVDRRDRMMASLEKRQAIHADRLVISKIREHSAIELCNSISSLGPDLVSTVEGMFCDMSEKQLWPICADETSPYCFDMEKQIVRSSTTNAIVAGSPNANSTMSAARVRLSKAIQINDETTAGPSVPSKAYVDVSTWEP